MDYQGNTKKEKEEKEQPKKEVKRVVTGEVVVQKKSLGRKFKDLFVEADFRSVMKYVVSDVLLPAARNMVVDASTKGIERMMYGDSSVRRGGYGSRSRITYNNPINRGYSNSVPSRTTPTSGRSGRSQDDYILSSRDEADNVLEAMNDIIDGYGIVSVQDLNDLVGFASSHTDNKWGWEFLRGVQIRQVREGYLIDLPPADPIQ